MKYLLILLMFSGCATYKTKWYNDQDASETSFYKAKTECMTSYSAIYSTNMRLYTTGQQFFSECMAGHGWTSETKLYND